MPDLLPHLQWLLLPATAFLWRISAQLATMTANITDHDRRLTTLERRPS